MSVAILCMHVIGRYSGYVKIFWLLNYYENPVIGSLIDSYTIITRKLWSLAEFQRFIIPLTLQWRRRFKYPIYTVLHRSVPDTEASTEGLTYHILETENAIQNYNNYENYFGIC
jgi:hypothetical protein